MSDRPSRRARLFLAVALLAAAVGVLALLHLPWISALSRFTLAGGTLLLLLWIAWRLFGRFLWKVGRRLAFSYFLLGVLPIPMVLLLLCVVGYILSGFFLGHLYRSAVGDLQGELDLLARERAGAFASGAAGQAPGQVPDVVFGYYRHGRRVSGDPRTPAAWPSWMEPRAAPNPDAAEGRTRFFDRRSGSTATLASAFPSAASDTGAVALYVGNLDLEVSRRSDLWAEIDRSDDPNLLKVELMGHSVPLRSIRKEQQAGESEKFFKRLSRGTGLWDRPFLWWAETSGPLLDAASGRIASKTLTVTLNATPRTLLRHLFLASGEVDSGVWVALFTLAVLLFEVYLVAALMAGFMIVGLSRAVNRMSAATAAVRSGDFHVRIPVKRRDQVGELQRSFNAMAEDLEALVATAAQKEALEKELELAREVQKSLIPSGLPGGEGVEFASLFEPSMAIGGDYFDVLRLSEHEVAVVIADVSGHGLSTGLRMAMIKAALLVLVEETRDPEEILRRLDGIVRNGGERRMFVTATLGIVDLEAGTLRLTNAGHPPTYVVRGSAVREILLPSSPLGALGQSYGRAELPLERGDLVVWLSDGLIEALGTDGEPFGYDRIVEVLGQGAAGQRAADLRDRLLTAIAAHVAGAPPQDDRTLVVMRYRGKGGLGGLEKTGEVAL